MTSTAPLRVGFVPEHFSTPLHFAKKHFGLAATLIPFPSGTGHMITSLRLGEIDVGIGLTEGWVAGLGKPDLEGDGGYRIVGTYVETPLCWAISTGAKRPISSVADLKNGKIGVSRIGSGSYVMGFVLADLQGWLSSPSAPPFENVPLQTFEKLRQGVNDGTVDFFMWEHFTSKRYYDNGEIKKIGEIYTPWSSWQIVASSALLKSINGARDSTLTDLFEKIDKGVAYLDQHHEETIEYIGTELDYSMEDAAEWLKTVRFASRTEGANISVVEKTIDVLKKAGVLRDDSMCAEEMIGKYSGAQLP
ncbi:hypothetical protein OIDMADRAFT_178924 [Oidiodendron maius Zn]|uniref:Ca3427-like PBP 2 domain-containing protein n=1 Tax=Oidiodendron maius (strain Zn) TaxID=913774 RepID=A0A0C3H096_OIDMZ|nr:hypothetical protein OIDMADRAFT_178924 [Oidiodendron maius Zn]